MKQFLENPDLLLAEVNELITIAQTKTFITVGIEIQKKEIEVLKQYISDLAALKKAFVKENRESAANLVYCLRGMIRVFQYELEMLVNIKEDKMTLAWGNLVDAQVVLKTVIRNFQFDTTLLEKYGIKWVNYERLLFPKMFFSSVGGIIKKSECSICHRDPNECDHLKGKLYMGELCGITAEIAVEEISMVDNPANKHCRMLTIESGDKTFDILTLREQEKSDEKFGSEQIGYD